MRLAKELDDLRQQLAASIPKGLTRGAEPPPTGGPSGGGARRQGPGSMHGGASRPGRTSMFDE